MKFFTNCTALITGASSGLGLEFARQLAPYASTLVLVARRNDLLEQLRTEIQETFPALQVFPYVADLSNEEQRVRLTQWLQDQGIRVNLLINNAGLGDHGAFDSSDWSRIRTILDTNITALTHLCHLLLPSLSQTERPTILNVSSVAGFFPLPYTAVYAASKAYVTSLTEALAIELKPKGITVTALCPGPVPTEFSQIAARPGSESRPPHHETMPLFTATPQEVVYTALRAVVEKRARIIPNPFLYIAVTLALAIPFCITRKILAANRTKL